MFYRVQRNYFMNDKDLSVHQKKQQTSAVSLLIECLRRMWGIRDSIQCLDRHKSLKQVVSEQTVNRLVTILKLTGPRRWSYDCISNITVGLAH